MKVSIKLAEALTVHAEGETVQDVFKQIADAQETFEDTQCGNCNSKHIKYIVRTVEDNTFYEIWCKTCRHKLTFGTSKQTKKLYPKRLQVDAKGKALKDENGKSMPLGTNGWHKYQLEDKEED